MNFTLPFFVAACITFILTPIAILFANKHRLVDDPSLRFHPAHTHTGVVPRAGGVAIYAGLLITVILFLPMTKQIIGILAGGALLAIVGLLDDRRDVNPYIRLTTNAIAALLVIGAGVGIPFVTNPLTGGVIQLDTWRISFEFLGNTHSILVWSGLFAFLWIMWTMNIIGWSAGVDGQMPGFVGIAAFAIALLALRMNLNDTSHSMVVLLAIIVSGVFAGFTPWNFFPQKIMPGYGGKTLAGFLLAVLAILSYGKVGTALLVLGMPTIDAIYTLVRRIVHKKSPVLADRGHLHHRLLDLGWGKRRIALFYWGVSAILGAVALSVTSQQKMFTFLLVAVGFGAFIVWVNFFTQFSKRQDPDNG